MELGDLILFLIIGAIAGWLSGLLTKGSGFGLIGNIIVGVLGSFIGSLVFGLLGLSENNVIGSILVSTVGAVLLLIVVHTLKKA
ncbi:MAG: GlsB/YeaQ/YmgE family stress response membrane protein [Planctomycetota bacterium]|jgi:uncharacterized membrane protein YeaQ/YmgE (transglycosylase-associated protein family)|nr:GlsB/YeaQ/YmgE family stress response membrane protein [Planctomycetota bacterium]